jgi:ABC-2 type transport system permease protein
MIDAFVFLISRSFMNRMKSRFQRLKQPKYLIGAIFGVLYLSWYFIQIVFFGGKRGGPSQFAVDDSILPVLGVVVLFLFAASAWIFPHARAALAFTEAEVAFLFPAPVSRRMLIHFKLLRSQFAIFFTVLLLTLFTGRLLVDSHAWMRVLGWWVILSTLGLHFLGASFVRTLLLERGISNWSRRLVVLLVLAALLAATILWARNTLSAPAFDNMTDWRGWMAYARELVATPPLSYVLYPFRLVIAPFLASTPFEFFKAMPAALGLIALHYLWVIRSNVAFEEASLDLSRRMAERVTAARQGRALDGKPAKGQRTPFRLAPIGFAPVAFLWKNLIHVQAAFRARTFVFFLLPLGIMAVFMAQSGSRSGALSGVASILLLMFFIWSLLLGPQLVRCDFRQDLNSMDVLKLFPLRGWQVVTGEILAPVVILTAIQWLLLIGIGVMMLLTGEQAGLLRLPLSWLIAAALLAPFWNGLALLIPNATVLLFPGWFQTRTDAPQGIEVTGQRLLLFFGQIVLISVTVIPAGLAFALGFAPLFMAGATNLAPLVGAVAAAITFAGEIVGGVWLVGKLFDRFDLAAEQGV